MNPIAQQLKRARVLKTKELVKAFNAVDRKDFVLEGYEESAYVNVPLPIGKAQTISQPYTVAFMLELLQPQKGEKILDVGAGSGWTTALIAHIVGSQGSVYGVELMPELTQLGKDNLLKYDFPQAEILQAKEGVLGFPDKAPFDKVLVSAAATDLPQELLSQLKEGGIMVLPVRSAILKIHKISKHDLEIERFEGFAFVPLL